MRKQLITISIFGNILFFLFIVHRLSSTPTDPIVVPPSLLVDPIVNPATRSFKSSTLSPIDPTKEPTSPPPPPPEPQQEYKSTPSPAPTQAPPATNTNTQQAPTEPTFINRCNSSDEIKHSDSHDLFSPLNRPPTLVIYVYTETSNLKASNFNYFLKHGLCETCHNIDYVIIVNGATSSITLEIPNHSNLRVVRRDNYCGDFGAWEYFFKMVGDEYMQKYKRIMFLNDTVKGPFIDPNYLLLFKGLHFTDIFGAHLNEHTRLVGSYISCGSLWVSPVGYSHVQTMSFMLDDVAFKLARKILICYEDRYEAIMRGEIGLSQYLLENNVNIGSVMYAYQGVDFRCNDVMRLTCNNATNPSMTDHKYYGIAVSLTEVVFVKDTTPYLDKEITMYEEWLNRKSDM